MNENGIDYEILSFRHWNEAKMMSLIWSIGTGITFVIMFNYNLSWGWQYILWIWFLLFSMILFYNVIKVINTKSIIKISKTSNILINSQSNKEDILISISDISNFSVEKRVIGSNGYFVGSVVLLDGERFQLNLPINNEEAIYRELSRILDKNIEKI